jgi:hypothetical protein
MSTDPKYIGVPNIQFSLTSKDDNREVNFSKQRIERGFDDSETWSLDNTISNFIIPRLRRFNEVKINFPIDMSMSEWTDKIDKMIEAFELNIKDTISEDEQEKITEGLDLFRQYFFNLWW